MTEENDRILEPAIILTSEETKWLKELYQEGWRQYVHEDNLGQTRTNFFLGLQAAIVAITGTVTSPVYRIGYISIFGHQLHLGLISLGCLWIITALFSIYCIINWQLVTNAGKQYVRFRRIQLRAIEELSGVFTIGLATQECKWLEKKEGEYVPFPQVESIKDFSLSPIIADSGWVVMEKTIRWLRIMWFLILFAGIALIVIGAFPVFFEVATEIVKKSITSG